jgi:hypothetical protein
MNWAEIIDKLQATKSQEEWNAVCDEVKAGVRDRTIEGPYSGDYPAWWFSVVVVSGLMKRMEKKWIQR